MYELTFGIYLLPICIHATISGVPYTSALLLVTLQAWHTLCISFPFHTYLLVLAHCCNLMHVSYHSVQGLKAVSGSNRSYMLVTFLSMHLSSCYYSFSKPFSLRWAHFPSIWNIHLLLRHLAHNCFPDSIFNNSLHPQIPTRCELSTPVSAYLCPSSLNRSWPSQAHRTCTWIWKVICSRLIWTSARRIQTCHSDLYHLPLLCLTVFLASRLNHILWQETGYDTVYTCGPILSPCTWIRRKVVDFHLCWY